ncbi:MAG: acyloxyacyl hydrolase [Micavibrio sp.]
MKRAQWAVFGLLLSSFMPLTPVYADDIDRLSLGIGAFDAFDSERALDFRVEYRPGTSIVWELRPFLGAEITSDGAIYGAAGFLYDYNMGNQWSVTPSLAGGLYSDGGGKDMGSAIQFRSQIELGYELENSSRVSAALSHTSNLGINDTNPSAETLGIYYHIPMQWVKSGPGSNN